MSTNVERQVYDLASFCKAYSISRSFAYLEIKAGRLKPFKAGRKTLISREAAEAWRRALEEVRAELQSTATTPRTTRMGSVGQEQVGRYPQVVSAIQTTRRPPRGNYRDHP